MIMIYTEEELEWIDTKTMGWPIKENCPSDIKKSIERKMEKQKATYAEMFGED